MKIKLKFFITLFVVAVLFALGFLLQSVSQAATGVEKVPGEILVKFKPGADIRSIHAANGTRTLEVIPRINVHVVGLGPGVDSIAAVERFNKNPNVEYAMSFGGYSGSLTVESAVNYAWNKGVVLVAAAGNDGTSDPLYPAFYENVIAVAATDKNDALASFSNFGTWVDVAAPGTSILSTYTGFNPPYAFASGTSMASPHVAGLLASQGRNNASIRATIENTTDNKGLYPIANGRINIHSAVDSP